MKEKIIAGTGLGFAVASLALSLMYLVTEWSVPGLIPFSLSFGFLMIYIQQKKYHDCPLWIRIIIMSVAVAAFIIGCVQIIVMLFLNR